MCKGARYETRLADGILFVLGFSRTPQQDIVVVHKFGNNTHQTIVRQDERGARYFHAHGHRVYVSDLRKVGAQ